MLEIPRITTIFLNTTIVLNLLIFMELATYEDLSLDNHTYMKPWNFYTSVFIYKNFDSFDISNFLFT